jgi:adenosylcobinamide kinase/adenosylcobinamide-phosphate guanylyltransferase
VGAESTVTLVLGGVRSGKSRFAQGLLPTEGRVAFVATATVTDPEMAARIEAHRRRRPPGWHTIEAPLSPAGGLKALPPGWDGVLVDCLTLLTSNWLLNLKDPASALTAVRHELDRLFGWSAENRTPLVLVSNEVGLGVHPTTELGRHFQDVLGEVNQFVAARADTVYLIVAGIPVTIKQAGQQ